MPTSTILFVAGLNCTAELFAPQIAALSPDFECRVADHTRGDTIAAIADAVLGEAPDRFALCGLSLGGYIALEMARRAPDRVERLALLSTQATPESDAAREKRLPRIALAETGRFNEMTQAVWPEAVHPSRYGDAALRAVVSRMAEETGPQTWLRHTQAVMARPDARPTLSTLDVPTLVLVGAEDQITPPERAREMVAAMPKARLVIVPQCGHMSTLERPDEVNAALRQWMVG